jgi:hypothetical protein
VSQSLAFLASKYVARVFRTSFSADECPSANTKLVDKINKPLNKYLFIIVSPKLNMNFYITLIKVFLKERKGIGLWN